jgi:type IV pilus assembly protein PilE
LLGLANAMERHFTETNSYCNAAVTTVGTCTNATGSPTIYSATSPVNGGTPYYNLTINTATDSTYTLNAAPTGAQTNDTCGTLTLTHTGVKSAITSGCW